MKKLEVAHLRLNYKLNELLETNVSSNPFEQFRQWFNEVLKAEISEPNAMVLSTIADNKPKSRVVLLKGLDELGFTFFTNYESNKSAEITKNNYGSINFFWKELERQVRIEGIIEKVSEKESDDYHFSRPKGSQIGAWVSAQSSRIVSREVLNSKLAELEKEFETKPIPRPPHWGGFRLIPSSFEFWQGRPNRLHDRLLFEKSGGIWGISRLSP
jgi:pyridoxamine 5'-phosphate oxidase